MHGLSESVETVVQSADISRQQVQSMYELALDGDRLLRETTEQITALGSSALAWMSVLAKSASTLPPLTASCP